MKSSHFLKRLILPKMGCQGSKSDTKCKQENPKNGDAKTVNSETVVVLDESAAKGITPEQKELIMDTWKLLVENISNVGVITFMKNTRILLREQLNSKIRVTVRVALTPLFETHPDVQDVFMPFKGLSQEELRHSKELKAHGLRVMGFVQKVVARLDEPEKSENLLRELGRNHIMYGAKMEYVDLIGPQFVFAVKPTLEQYWTDDIEEAWIQLFSYMAYVMKKAMMECTSPCEDDKAPNEAT